MTDVNAINNGDGSPVSNNFTWNGAGNLSTVGVGPGDIGRLRFARNDGVISVDPAGSQLTIGANTVVELAGTVDALSDGTYHVDVNNNGALEVTAGVKNVGNVGGTSGTVTVNNGATLNANHVRGASLSVADATVLVRDSGSQPAGVSKVDDYTITGTGKIDLRDNKLITNKAIGTFDGTAYSGVQGDIQRAYNFGAWDQPGLMTSQPNAGQNAGPLSGTTTIGVATAEQVLFLGPTDTGLFMGETVTGASVIAMYTYAGDVNFDGVVDGADYGTLDNWFQFPGTDGYANGDVNYDGIIDGADYGVLDNTIQLQGDPIPGVFSGFASSAGADSSSGLSGVTAVPEPASLSVIALAGMSLLGRRRRK